MIIAIIFFFFKQKTAYEMRISDWSSDVCSSDLGTKRSITRITKDDLEQFPRERFGRDRLVVAVVGDITPADLRPLLDVAFGDLRAKTDPIEVPNVRSEERRVGKEGVSKCRFRWSPDLKNKKQLQIYEHIK